MKNPALQPNWVQFKDSLNEPALYWCWLRKLLKYYLYRQYSKNKKTPNLHLQAVIALVVHDNIALRQKNIENTMK